MEIKATVSFVLASLLLVTTWFSTSVEAVLPVCSLYPPSRCHPSLEAVDTEAMAPLPEERPPPEERPHSHPLIKALPAPAPEKPQAPCPPPANHHYHHAPGKAPFHPPEKHHYHRAPKNECPSRCEEHCKKDHHKKEEDEEEGRRCVRACTTCCCESKRAPEHKEKCKWSHMKMEGKKMKCP